MRARVLVVDYKEADFELVCRVLSATGHDLTCTEPGQALEHLEALPYHVVVMNSSMPELSGMELLTRLRRRHERLPVVMCTSKLTAVDEVVAVADQGFTEVVDGSIDSVALVRAVNRLLARTTPSDEVRFSSYLRLGRQLRSAREMRGMTLRQLSARCDVPVLRLVQLERGEILASIDELHGLARVLEARLSVQLLKDGKPLGPPPDDGPDEEVGAASILIVDDQEDIVSFYRLVLGQVGYEVVGTDHANAVERWQGGSYHLVVTGLNMPEVNGVELLRRIREHDRSIGVIMSSGSFSRDAIIEAMGLGLTGALWKPHAPQELQERVRRALQRSLPTAAVRRDVYRSLGRQLRQARVEQDVSSAELSRRIGLHPARLQQLEDAQLSLTLEELQRLASELGLQLSVRVIS